MLGDNPEFFVAHRTGTAEIVTMTVLGAFVVPLLLGGIVVLVMHFHRRAGLALHGLAVMVLSVILVMGTLKKTAWAPMPWWAQAALGLVGGAALLFGFHRSASLRWVLRFGVIVPVVLVGMFLFGSRASALVMPTATISAAGAVIPDGAPPIVLVVFDELPLASLIDGEGHLQAGPYPNLARLAATSTWYRDATTVAARTTLAIPAVVTGNRSPHGSIPTTHDHPDNLFTWAASGYDLSVMETVTELCPESLCDPVAADASPWERRRALWSDLRIVAGHVLVSDDLAERLPPISLNWSGFAADGSGDTAGGSGDASGSTAASGSEAFVIRERFAAAAQGRSAQISDFLDMIGPPGDRPALYFAHLLLPHEPWVYLPDGRQYDPVPIPSAGKRPAWSDDAWAVTQAHQRHLSQVEYVDRVVGMVIDRLVEAGVFDEAIVVVTADHGVAVRPGLEHRRGLEEGTVPDLVSVPLFIKAPGQEEAAVDDYPAELTDVAPTIAEMVGAALPWDPEGVSLSAQERPARPTRVINPPGDPRTIEITSPFPDVLALAAHRLETFGPDGAFGLAPPGYADLLGTPVEDFEVEPAGRFAVRIPDGEAFRDVDLDAAEIPVVVRGQLRRRAGQRDPGDVVAVAVNGTISAVTETYALEDRDGIFFVAMTNPAHLVDGANDIQVFLVTDSGGRSSLRALTLIEPEG